MKLGIHERFALLNLLPIEESYPGMRDVVEFKMLLNLTGDEEKEIELKRSVDPQSNRVQMGWNPLLAESVVVDIPVSHYIFNLIRDILRRLSDTKKIREDQLSLYEKFVMDYEQV